MQKEKWKMVPASKVIKDDLDWIVSCHAVIYDEVGHVSFAAVTTETSAKQLVKDNKSSKLEREWFIEPRQRGDSLNDCNYAVVRTAEDGDDVYEECLGVFADMNDANRFMYQRGPDGLFNHDQLWKISQLLKVPAAQWSLEPSFLLNAEDERLASNAKKVTDNFRKALSNAMPFASGGDNHYASVGNHLEHRLRQLNVGACESTQFSELEKTHGVVLSVCSILQLSEIQDSINWLLDQSVSESGAPDSSLAIALHNIGEQAGRVLAMSQVNVDSKYAHKNEEPAI